MTSQPHDPMNIVFSPAQVARTGTAFIEQRMSTEGVGIPFGVPSVDYNFLPLLEGELLTLLARPGHGKTANLMRWARHRAIDLRIGQLNQHSDRIVVYATLEQPIEELHAFHVAAETGVPVDLMARGKIDEGQMALVRDYGVRRSAVPLWFIGYSIERRKKRPLMNLAGIADALRRIENWEQDTNQRDFKIDMLFIDYLQRLPYDSRESKVIGIDMNLNILKDMALEFACPVCVGVQARREVDERSVPVPELGDGQWCSGIEQVSDRVLSCVRPIKYTRDGEMFGKTVVEGRNQMLLAILKQKMGDAPFTHWLTFDPRYNRLDEAEERVYNFNQMMEDKERWHNV